MSFKIILVNLLIAGIPFLIFLTYLAPRDTDVWDTGIIEISKQNYGSARLFVYDFLKRLVFALELLVFFFVIDRYITFGVVIAFFFQVYRIIGCINPNARHVDQWEWKFVIPIALITIFGMYYIRYKFKTKISVIELATHIDTEIERIKNKPE